MIFSKRYSTWFLRKILGAFFLHCLFVCHSSVCKPNRSILRPARMHEKDKEGKDKRDREIRVVVHLLLQSTLTIYSYLLTYLFLITLRSVCNYILRFSIERRTRLPRHTTQHNTIHSIKKNK